MRQPNLTTCQPHEIVSYLKSKIREIFGDRTENKSQVYSIKGGWYYVNLPDYEWRSIGFRRSKVPNIVAKLRKINKKGI